MDENKIVGLELATDKKISAKPIGHLFTFYLSGQIGPCEDYVSWFEIIRNANEMDLIKIHINSPGGDLFTAIQFMRVISESKARVISSVEGACMSAATMIFMCSHAFEISEHSVFMFHNYSGFAMGKGGEMYDNIIHERKWSDKIFRNVYEGFLTQDEIKSILDNKDIWMEGEEVMKRLESKIKKEENNMKKVKAKNDRKPTKKSK